MAMIFAAEQGPVHGRYEIYKEHFNWDGMYTPASISATLFNTVLYHYLEGALRDEMGNELFQLFLSTHQVQRAQVYLMHQPDSPWWDDVSTPNVKETRKQILANAFMKATDILRDKFGDNPTSWQWREVCSLELKHPLGEVAVLKPLVNRGPYEVYGGNETILQSGFKMDSTGTFKVFFGSQMRIIADMAFPEQAVSITPSGQSGHLMSGHYSDQTERYVQLEFRQQLLNEMDIRKKIPFHFEPR
jgi:penicillin G amidase